MHATAREADAFRFCSGSRLQSLLTGLAGDKGDRALLVAMVVAVGWLPAVALSATAGTGFRGVEIPLFRDLEPWVRFFVVAPIAILAEPFCERILGQILSYLHSSGIVAESCRQAFENDVHRAQRLSSSTTVELVLATLVLALPHLMTPTLTEALAGATSWATAASESGVELTRAGRWYAWVSIPILQWLLLRWAWRLLIWWNLLWRISRMPLAIAPGHPDRMGGLEHLTAAPLAFLPVLAALGSLASSGAATAILLGSVEPLDLSAPIAGFVVLELLSLVLPQLFFTPLLARARRQALAGFGATGAFAARRFEGQWAVPKAIRAQGLLDSNHPSAMSDYGGSYSFVYEMRPFGLDLRRLALFVSVLLLPFVPLLLFEYSLSDLLHQVFTLLR